jgi:hypothetical protein
VDDAGDAWNVGQAAGTSVRPRARSRSALASLARDKGALRLMHRMARPLAAAGSDLDAVVARVRDSG